MRYDDEEVQDLLAAQYVLGSLRGAARRRLVTLMRQHPSLRHRVEHWEQRMFALIIRAPKVKAPERVWSKIQARISPSAERAWRRRTWWMGFATAGLSFALAALLYVGVAPPRQPSFTTIALLNDQRAQPGILVSWTPSRAARRHLSVRILAHPEMPAGTSWQAWIVTGRDAAPISLGLIGADEYQVLPLSAEAADALPGAVAIGVSVEPKGGSVAGRPSGPFLLQGPALRVDG